MSEIVGLPLHPLVVHFAVVTVPVAAICLAVTVWTPAWRTRYGSFIVGLALAGAAASILAAQTGGPLRRSLRDVAALTGAHPDFGNHPALGNAAEVLAITLAFASLGIWGLDRWAVSHVVSNWLWPSARIAVLAVSCAAVVLMVLAGDSGARLVWQQLGTFVPAAR